MNNTEKWIINTATLTAWSHTKSEEEAQATLERATQYEAECADRCERNAIDYPNQAEYFKRQAEQHRKAKFEIMTYEEYHNRQREKMLAGEPIEITLEEWEHALDILPPERWMCIDGVSEFCMSEHLTANYTTQYAKDLKTGKCYCKTVDVYDITTWIHNYIRRGE